LEVVTDAEAQRCSRRNPPFVLDEALVGMVLDVLVVRTGADREALGIRSRVRRIEYRIVAERERAVFVDLRHAPQLGEVVANPELPVMVAVFRRKEPRIGVLEHVVGIPRSLRFGARLREKAGVIELRRTERLIAHGFLAPAVAFRRRERALSTEALVAMPPVLPGARHPERVDARVAHDAGQR